MSDSRAAAPTLEAAAQELLQRHAGEWFPDLQAGPLQVSVASQEQRPRCLLLRYRLQSGNVQHDVLVKGRRETPEQSGGDRPRLALPVVEPVEALARRELGGLAAIEGALAGADASRFAAVRPLALLEGHAALVMEFVPAPTLRSVLLRSALRRRRVPDEVWRNAGAWLALFQQGASAAAEDLPVRHGTRQEVADLFARFALHIGASLDDRRLGSELARYGECAADLLPPRLAVVPVHHDFVARNVLVGEGGQVRLIDPMMSARVPAHEDVGRFLVGLRANGVQLATRGLAVPAGHLDRYERLFLEGYGELGGDLGPSLRVVHALVLLDRWASHVTPPRAPRSFRAEQLNRWTGRSLRSQAVRLLGSLA